ncbi:mitogen-activated protein kinase kinase kinase YODA [Trifolium repens]|nr:mitogen-activated protein kinase kinase kinase YODA [Trifolium repens]
MCMGIKINHVHVHLVAHNFAADTATEQAAAEDLHRRFKSGQDDVKFNVRPKSPGPASPLHPRLQQALSLDSPTQDVAAGFVLRPLFPTHDQMDRLKILSLTCPSGIKESFLGGEHLGMFIWDLIEMMVMLGKNI